jgi:hypothetical protein
MKGFSMMNKTMVSLAAFALGGCAGVVLPPDSLERNEASIKGADELGAQSVPDAKLHLQMARDETDQAKKLAASGDDRAPLVLARAQSDADLALAMARQTSVHADAVKAAEDLKAVKAVGAP